MVTRSRLLRVGAVIAAAHMLAACASGARVEAMAVPLAPDALAFRSSPAFAAISVGTVTGGSETNPLWKSQVSNENFQEALRRSLAAHGMAANGQGRYRLDAELVALDQPFLGFNMTVTAKVHYRLVSADPRQPAQFDQTIETPYTARFGDDLNGVERLRLANENAIRENIDVLIKELLEALQAPRGNPSASLTMAATARD